MSDAASARWRWPDHDKTTFLMKIGIIRERKNPPDNRTPLTPKQCRELQQFFGFEVQVERSPGRCFTDAEYEAEGLQLTDDVSGCDVLLGVKEVPVDHLIAGKTYFFFSHTIKKQPYNRPLLRAVLEKEIRLVDYETITDGAGKRLIAFGYYAGVVGAHNGLWAWGERLAAGGGRRTEDGGRRTADGFRLPRMKDCHDYEEVLGHYKKMRLPPIKIVLTGTGRVAQGCLKVLHDLKIRQVSPTDFLGTAFDGPVFTQLSAEHYARRKDGGAFEKARFYAHGDEFESAFAPFARLADLMMNGIFYDKNAPMFFTQNEMAQPDFRIKVIADISCDMAPHGSVPATIEATTIADPLFGFDPKTGGKTVPFLPGSVTMMTVDNLPNELPRDASQFFGKQFLENLLTKLLAPKSTDILDRATIARFGKLTPNFDYLQDYVDGKN